MLPLRYVRRGVAYINCVSRLASHLAGYFGRHLVPFDPGGTSVLLQDGGSCYVSWMICR